MAADEVGAQQPQLGGQPFVARQRVLRARLEEDPETAPWIEEPHLFQNYKQLQFFDGLALYDADILYGVKADLSDQDLRDGQVFWTTLDAPWVHQVDGPAFEKELDTIRKMEPKWVLSSHLPAAPGRMTDQLLSSLAAARTATPFIGPNQARLEQKLAQMLAVLVLADQLPHIFAARAIAPP